MDHYTPEHPLPTEIQSMERDDTVCKFCGVSYLIHNEIKALEDKLTKVEAELSVLRGSEERERKLQASLDTSKNENSLLQAQLQERDSLVAMLQDELQKKTCTYEILEAENNKLKEELKDQENSVTKMRKDNSHLRQVLTELLVTLKQQKEAITSTKQDMNDYATDSANSLQLVHRTMQMSVARTQQLEREQELKIDQLKQEREEHESTISRLSTQLQQEKVNSSETDKLYSQISHIEAERDKALAMVKDGNEESQMYKDKLRKMAAEMEALQESYLIKSKEFDTVNEQFKLSQHTYESRITSLDNDLTHGEEELERVKLLYTQLVRENEAVRQQQLEKERAAARSKGESEDMRTKLERVLGDLEAFKLEREQMISAHQNRIEDLRESFKRKISEADKWPQKMEQALHRERSKHQAELAALETAMKENFVMEMEIEKQKHQKLLDKMSQEMKSEVARLRNQLRSEASNQSEIDALKQQLRTTKADAQGTEARLRSEVENLKNIISNLENRLGKLDTGDKELMLQLKSQLSDKERSLEDSSDKIRSQEEEITRLKEQLRILQDTVSRECEERMELIDALGEAREQLLHLKKPAGGYTSSRTSSPKLPASLPTKTTPPKENLIRPISPAASVSSLKSANKEEMLLFRRTHHTFGRRASNSTASTGSGSASSDNKEQAKITNGNVKALNFQPESDKGKPLQGLKAMDSNQKKRIAAILSRTQQ